MPLATTLLPALLFLVPVCSFISPATKPSLGTNSWNSYHCSVNASILLDTAKALVSTGLAKAGYLYINSDDCWALANRSADGRQVADPARFPDGFAAVVSQIHALGLKAGIYTAEAVLTCAKFAASCDHEYLDAAQWAEWGIDYVKASAPGLPLAPERPPPSAPSPPTPPPYPPLAAQDDGCGPCPNRTDDENYRTMFSAIAATGRPMVLTVEGSPNVTGCSALGGCGNAHRVGHDSEPLFMSALSEVDLASGLWPLAHNASNATAGAWFNDLDILCVGNAPDFLCGADAAALARCRVHFSMHAMLKSPLLLGNDLAAADAATLAVLGNGEALAINQDPLGAQAVRTRIAPPAASALSAALPGGANAVWGRCAPQRPTQAWSFARTGPTTRAHLYLVPCNASDPWQQWAAAAGAGGGGGGGLRNAGAGACIDTRAGRDPAGVAACQPAAPAQAWAWQPATGHLANGGQCLDVFANVGPDVEAGGACKVPGQGDANQAFDFEQATGLLRTRVPGLAGQCLGVEASPLVYVLATADSSGRGWMLGGDRFPVNAQPGVPANASRAQARWTLACPPSSSNGTVQCLLGKAGGGGLEVSSTPGGSGPWPHTLYSQSYTWHPATPVLLQAAAALAGQPVAIQWPDTQHLLDNDLVGNVTAGGAFCLDLVTAGVLETWVAPLSGGRAAAALLNRSPGPDTLSVTAADLGWPPGSSFEVRDVWAAADRGTFKGSYTATVEAAAVALLVLTPV